MLLSNCFKRVIQKFIECLKLPRCPKLPRMTVCVHEAEMTSKDEIREALSFRLNQDRWCIQQDRFDYFGSPCVHILKRKCVVLVSSIGCFHLQFSYINDSCTTSSIHEVCEEQTRSCHTLGQLYPIDAILGVKITTTKFCRAKDCHVEFNPEENAEFADCPGSGKAVGCKYEGKDEGSRRC